MDPQIDIGVIKEINKRIIGVIDSSRDKILEIVDNIRSEQESLNMQLV